MRTPEQGHTKKCLARALICIVENSRDEDGQTDIGFHLDMQRSLIPAAFDLYDGLLDCICPPWTQP